jgi:hypothetical protein
MTMAHWQGVLKYDGRYFIGARGRRWSADSDSALVFPTREAAREARDELRAQRRRKSGVDPYIQIVRRRRPSERLREEREARMALTHAATEADHSARAAERERIARWLDTWHRLSAMLLALPSFAAADAHRTSFTQGMVSVLEQASLRIRAELFHTEWDYRPGDTKPNRKN